MHHGLLCFVFSFMRSTLPGATAPDGIGIGFFMESDVVGDIAAGWLAQLREDWTPPADPLRLTYPGRPHQSPALKAFRTLTRELGSGTGKPASR
jgi:DNA-binding transcriptional LysR family regulator